MARADASDVTTSCGGDAGDILPMTEMYSSIVASGECVTAAASISTSSQSCEYVSAGMSEEQISAAIETSREQGWSELKDSAQDDAMASSSHTHVIWEELKKKHPWFFRDFSEDELKLGRVIAEGGQAHIYEASLNGVEWYVAKVFKMEGFSLADLQCHWPLTTKAPIKSGATFVLGGVVFGEFTDFCNPIMCGTFLKDGRFTFVMRRCWGDLRTLINLRLSCSNSPRPPFSPGEALMIMWEISKGMVELHERGVLHRDLKAANVLVDIGLGDEDPRYDGNYYCKVADFESAMLVHGTKFWRAPEVLEELLKEPSDRNAKVDAYSFAMTCYEILTGHTPFDGYVKSDWKRVIDGERPHLPNYINPGVQELVERCWHKELSKRPPFKVIESELGEVLKKHSTTQDIRDGSTMSWCRF